MQKLKSELKPKNWRRVKLGEISKVETGGTPSRRHPEYFRGGAIPWLKTQELNDGYIYDSEEKITKEAIKESNAKLFPINTILIAMYGATVGKLGYLKRECSTNQAFAAILPNESVYDSKFLFYLLLHERGKLTLLASGAAQQNLNLSIIKNFEVKIPEDINEQKRIADILSSFDDKIELNNKINETLEKMAQEIFNEWFVKFRFPGWEKVKMVDSKLGKIPEDWEIKRLSEIFDFLEGPGIRNWQYTKKGVPFINIRLIQNNDINVKEASFISFKEANEKYKHFQLQEKDMVISTSGTLGRSAIVRKEHLPLLLNTSVIRFRPKDKKNYAFMYQFLKSFYFQNKLFSMASGSAQPNFGPIHLKQILIVFPNKLILDKLNEILNPIYEKIIAYMSENQKLATMRDLLLPKLMNGEIEV